MTSPCPNCPMRPGSKECHCPTCGEHFTTPGNFDRHRRNGACLPPPEAGLVPAKGRREGAKVWSEPGRIAAENEPDSDPSEAP